MHGLTQIGRTGFTGSTYDFEQRAELLAADAETYYITDHYKEYPAVLVRLPRVTPDVLRDLLGMAYRRVAGEATHKSRNPRSRYSNSD